MKFVWCIYVKRYVAYFLKFSYFKNSFVKNAESCGFQHYELTVGGWMELHI